MATLAAALDRVVDLAGTADVRAAFDRLEVVLARARQEQSNVTGEDATWVKKTLSWVAREDLKLRDTLQAWREPIDRSARRHRSELDQYRKLGAKDVVGGKAAIEIPLRVHQTALDDAEAILKVLDGTMGWLDHRLQILVTEAEAWADLYREEIDDYARAQAAAAVRGA